LTAIVVAANPTPNGKTGDFVSRVLSPEVGKALRRLKIDPPPSGGVKA